MAAIVGKPERIEEAVQFQRVEQGQERLTQG
jgi:hypothetical protein